MTQAYYIIKIEKAWPRKTGRCLSWFIHNTFLCCQSSLLYCILNRGAHFPTGHSALYFWMDSSDMYLNEAYRRKQNRTCCRNCTAYRSELKQMPMGPLRPMLVQGSFAYWECGTGPLNPVAKSHWPHVDNWPTHKNMWLTALSWLGMNMSKHAKMMKKRSMPSHSGSAFTSPNWRNTQSVVFKTWCSFRTENRWSNESLPQSAKVSCKEKHLDGQNTDNGTWLR